MGYTPENNPYIPGDPYSYDLAWMVQEVKTAQKIGQSAQQYANDALQSKIEAQQAKDLSMAWAIGEDDGGPIPPGEPQYENNAKYYAEQAEDSAQSAADDAQSAHDSEVAAANYANNIADPVSGIVTDWLANNITQPTTPAIDSSLSVAGAAADAKAAGDAITYLSDEISSLGTAYPNILYSKASILNTPQNAVSANETYNGGAIPYSFISGELYLVMYKLKITDALNSNAGLVRPTLIGYDGGFRRCSYTPNTPHIWLNPSEYTLGDEITLWDVVTSPYTSSNYQISLHCPSNTNPFTQNTTKVEYSAFAAIHVNTLEEGAALAHILLDGFTFKTVYFNPIISAELIQQILTNTLTGINVFSRFCVIGDSLSVGFYTDSNNVQHMTDYAHSWPYYLEKIFGSKAYWAGYSGQTCATWLAQTSGTWGLNYTQNLGSMPLYILCMGANEYGTTIGSIADIYDDSPTTLYGYVGKTVRELKSISPKCAIICTGVNREQSTASIINAVYQDVCSAFTDCYYYEIQPLLNTLEFTECFYNSHYSALGYERMARLYNWLINEIINLNTSNFLYINEADITTQPK